jgi:hypothetical protein
LNEQPIAAIIATQSILHPIWTGRIKMANRGRQAGFKMGPEHRGKIANSNILKGLIEFAEGKIKHEDYPPHRVTASLGLLKKIMPDLAAMDVSGSGENGEVEFTFKWK